MSLLNMRWAVLVTTMNVSIFSKENKLFLLLVFSTTLKQNLLNIPKKYKIKIHGQPKSDLNLMRFEEVIVIDKHFRYEAKTFHSRYHYNNRKHECFVLSSENILTNFMGKRKISCNLCANKKVCSQKERSSHDVIVKVKGLKFCQMKNKSHEKWEKKLQPKLQRIIHVSKLTIKEGSVMSQDKSEFDVDGKMLGTVTFLMLLPLLLVKEFIA
ncbi:CLUMA_CG015465, isoform A [Clunio marinus]|uniref:CLUMA_CG015465, isoform A n=1 Tax=Clunio marinus TaxID=568069 RepID=A0A1J1IQM8_9DIPT|nr:CLUMA_CG015465, isoform A [Clunio marinus]